MKTTQQFRWASATTIPMMLAAFFFTTLPTTACGDDSGNPDPDAQVQDADTTDASTLADAGPQEPVDCDEFVCPGECVIYVDHTAFSGGDGTTSELALRHVQDGIAEAASLAGPCCRCEVWVAEGSYHVRVTSQHETIQLVERVDLYGGYPTDFGGARDPTAHPTVLSGRSAWDADLSVHHVVTGADDCLLDGFVIEGGRALIDDNALNADNYGAGLLNLGVSPRVENCVFRDNQALNGGAVYNLDSQAQFLGCRFEDNRATQRGGAMLNRRSPILLRHGHVLRNEATDGAGLFNSDTSDATLINCVVAGNVATGAGGGLRNEASSPTLIQVSLGENVAATGGGLYNDEGSSPRVVNSILHHDDPDEVVNLDAGSTPTITYTNVMGGCTVASGCTTDETGNLDVNPLYADREGLDLRLFHSSPVIDQGDNSAVPADLLTDIDGNARIRDGVTDGAGTVDLGADEARMLAEYPVVHVDQSAWGADDGSSWTDAYYSLVVAFREATPLSIIWVASGVYVPSDIGDRRQPFEMPSGVLVLGGFDPSAGADTMATRDASTYETVLSGDLFGNDEFGLRDDNAMRVINAGSSAELDGFTITAAWDRTNAVGSSAMYIGKDDRVWIRHCRFHDNYTTFAAGAIRIETGAAPVIEHCHFENNRADEYGGAIYLAIPGAGARIAHSVFINNRTSYSGGAIFVYQPNGLELADCVFQGNGAAPGAESSVQGGAIFAQDSDLLVQRCQFTDNLARLGGAVSASYALGSTLTFEDCHFEGNRAEMLTPMSWCDPQYPSDYGSGGAIYARAGNVVIRGSTFLDNEALMTQTSDCANSTAEYLIGVGGAVLVNAGNLDVTGSTFVGNRAEGPAHFGGNGGALASFQGVLRVSNSHFTGNHAVNTGFLMGDFGGGGAIWLYDPPSAGGNPNQGSWVVGSVLAENVAWRGGGIYVRFGEIWLYQLVFSLNEATYQNAGAGIHLMDADVYLRNSIIWGNIGFGSYSPTVTQVSPDGYQCTSTNRVFAANTDIQVAGLPPADGCLRDCNDLTIVRGECTAPRYITPSFVQAGGPAADYHHSGTECADQGDNTLLPPDWHDLDGDGDVTEPLPVDLDGNPRVNGVVDLGPYERP